MLCDVLYKNGYFKAQTNDLKNGQKMAFSRQEGINEILATPHAPCDMNRCVRVLPPIPKFFFKIAFLTNSPFYVKIYVQK